MNYPPSFFSSYLIYCPVCKADVLDSVFDITINGTNGCENCNSYFEAFKRFWVDYSRSTDDISLIARNPSARILLKRVFLAFSYKGIHKPLLLPGSIKVEVTRRCNLNCKHCLAVSSSDDYPELSLNEIVDLLTQAHKLGVSSVGLVGGEPLIRKDLPQIVEAAVRLGLFYSISTNGMLITSGKVKELKSKYLRKFSISLDGDKMYHNHLRMNKNAYDFALRGVDILKEEGVPVAIAMMINKDNKDLIQNVIEDSIKHGADFFVINDLIPTGRGLEIKEKCLSYPEYREVTLRMKELRKEFGNSIEILWKGMNPGGPGDKDLGKLFNSKCGAGLTELTINNDGYIVPCPFLPATSENIRNKSLKEIWYASPELKPYQNRDLLEDGCGSCHKQYSCSGCRARALAHTGSIHGPDVRCPSCQ